MERIAVKSDDKEMLQKRKIARIGIDESKDSSSHVAKLELELQDVRESVMRLKSQIHEYEKETQELKHYLAKTDKQRTEIKLYTDQDCEDFFKITFHFEFKKQEKQSAEIKRISNIRKFFKDNYKPFALQKGHANLVCKMKDFVEMSNSVGAVVVELDSDDDDKVIGTCFVIGSKYVITNRHVIENTITQPGFKDFYIDFEYGEGGCHKFRFSHDPVVSSPVDVHLDYAILELRDSGNDGKELPPSLSKCGYVIPTYDQHLDAGEWVALVGHPGGARKLMEDSCPLEHPKNLDRDVVLALRRDDRSVLHDNRRIAYGTSEFFYGSSGSPCVLLNEKLLVALHCRGFYLHDENHSIIEQGVRMSAIRDDVQNKIKSGVLPGLTLNDLFDIDPNNKRKETVELETEEIF